MASALTLNELMQGSRLQGRIIGALMLREMRTRFGEYRLGYAWALLEPLAQIGIMSTMFYLLGSRPPLGTSFEAFFFTGFVSFSFFRDLAQKGMSAISANRPLLSFPPVRNMDAVWARLALELITHLTSLFFVMVILGYLGVPIMPADPLKFAEGYLSIIVLGIGFGIFNATFSPLFKVWSILFSWFARVQFFISGVFFLPERLPPAALDYLRWNPTTHSLAYVREGFYGTYQSNILVEAYPFLVGIVLALVGLTLERVYRKQVSPR